ncbi:hypothetical protein ACJMK2_038754 [Sinanodonta woodiana]|uniref:Uncharacterized protein n=1 Tax=Sinanodonta woodiana TaxID=1069815 RepID=A0ABD3W9X5_SINWO
MTVMEAETLRLFLQRIEKKKIGETLLEAKGDADVSFSSVITSSSADSNKNSVTLLSEGSLELARRDDSAAKIIDDPMEIFGNCEDPASSEDNEVVPDIKPDPNKLYDVMLMQDAYSNMETIMRHKQLILDRMVKKGHVK